MSIFNSKEESTRISVIAQIRAKSGHEAEVRKICEGLVGPSQKEPGCLKYNIYEDKYYTGSFYTYEEWETEDALNVHLETNKTGLNQLKSLLREELRISVLKLTA